MKKFYSSLYSQGCATIKSSDLSSSPNRYSGWLLPLIEKIELGIRTIFIIIKKNVKTRESRGCKKWRRSEYKKNSVISSDAFTKITKLTCLVLKVVRFVSEQVFYYY